MDFSWSWLLGTSIGLGILWIALILVKIIDSLRQEMILHLFYLYPLNGKIVFDVVWHFLFVYVDFQGLEFFLLVFVFAIYWRLYYVVNVATEFSQLLNHLRNRLMIGIFDIVNFQ